jgi:hypothetical protein
VHLIYTEYIHPSVHYEKAVPRKTNEKYSEGKTGDWELFVEEDRVGVHASHSKEEGPWGLPSDHGVFGDPYFVERDTKVGQFATTIDSLRGVVQSKRIFSDFFPAGYQANSPY